MKPVDGAEVFKWPEFRAFAERLMVDLKLSTSCLTITIPKDGTVRIAQDTRGAGRDYSGKDRHLPENSIPQKGDQFPSGRPLPGRESITSPVPPSTAKKP